MHEGEEARTRDARYRDRRAYERFDLNASGGCLNYQGARYPCQIVDVSLSGCCLRTEREFLPGNLANVEIELPLLGMVLRMVGTTQWTTREKLIGVRFLHASARSKNQLASLLTGLVDESAVQEVQAAVAAEVKTGAPALEMKLPQDWLQKPAPGRKESPKPPPTGKPERSSKSVAQKMEEGDWPAILRLLKESTPLVGAIIGLRMEGCNFCPAEPFKAGIHIRVEVEFQMRGLPFRLGGVIEEIHDRRTVDIRFLEMSPRKQAELAGLIEEIEEAAKEQVAEETSEIA
jgi:hypothetical protein